MTARVFPTRERSPLVRRLLIGATMVGTACRAHPPGVATPLTQELRLVSDGYTQAPVTRDANAIVRFFAPDVFVMSPQGRTPVRGLDANRAAWERFFRGGNPVHTMTTDTVVVGKGGDLGYTRGRWTVAVDAPAGRAEAAGEYLAVWRRIGGQWKIVVVSAYPFPLSPATAR